MPSRLLRSLLSVFAATLLQASSPALASADDALLQAVRADAARRAGIAVERTRVIADEAVTWRDGGLGCPQPGVLYTQALVPGRRVRVEADGVEHDYHAGRRGGWTWCAPGRGEPPAADPSR